MAYLFISTHSLSHSRGGWSSLLLCWVVIKARPLLTIPRCLKSLGWFSLYLTWYLGEVSSSVSSCRLSLFIWSLMSSISAQRRLYSLRSASNSLLYSWRWASDLISGYSLDGEKEERKGWKDRELREERDLHQKWTWPQNNFSVPAEENHTLQPVFMLSVVFLNHRNTVHRSKRCIVRAAFNNCMLGFKCLPQAYLSKSGQTEQQPNVKMAKWNFPC